jgi:hypothetical protein
MSRQATPAPGPIVWLAGVEYSAMPMAVRHQFAGRAWKDGKPGLCKARLVISRAIRVGGAR